MQSSLPTTNKVIRGENGKPKLVEIPLEQPSTNQVLVKIEFAPINPTDLLNIAGHYKTLLGFDPPGKGSEGSGTIVAVGDNLKVPHKVGDRVHVNGPGTFQQYLVVSSEQASPILQPDLSFEDAASHFVNPATVHYMGYLAEKGNHKAAIHNAGSSALGRMLIRYFKQKGIKLINIVRREEYVEKLLKEEGADYVLNSTAPDFEAKLKELAEKENATIAFDAIAGDFTNKILVAQPPNSTIHVYGVLGGTEVKSISITELFKQKVLKSLFLPDYLNELTPEQQVKMIHEIHSLLPTVLRSHVQKKFKIDDYKEAFEYYHENSSKGKILLQFH